MEDIRGIHAYWADHSRTPPVNPTTSFKGKTVIVTGANVGLGFETAAKLHALETSKLILACRGIAKGEQAKSRILARQTLKPPSPSAEKDRIEVWQIDMLSYPSLKAFADRVSRDLPRVDAVILNAGVAARKHEKSAYGWERTLQVNTLSTTLLALLLLPKLRSQARGTDDTRPVLEVVGSGSQYLAKLKPHHRSSPNLLQSLNTPAQGYGVRAYNLSKLFVQHAVRTLADHESSLSPDGKPAVYITAVCPGSVRSEIARDYNGCFDEVGKAVLAKLLMRSTEEGSRSIVSGVVEVAAEGGRGHGRFWQHDRWREDAKLLQGEEGRALQARVWKEIVEALEKDVPEARELAGMV